jgi:S-formylglutathione hydrolase FrmB
VKSMSFRLVNHALLAAAGALAAVAMGCSGYGSTAACGGIYGACPVPTPTPPTASDCSHAPTFTGPIIVQLNLSFATCNDTTFGVIRGISDTNSASNIVKVSTGQNIQFSNVDGVYPHQIDFFGTWTGSFPPGDTSSAGQASMGTDIGTANFSTGVLGAGSSSLIYKTPASAGMYVFGDRLYYGGSNMRTVVIAM